MGRSNLRDEVPVTSEPGFYEPGRSPSPLLANWFWLHHVIEALRWRPAIRLLYSARDCGDHLAR
jgi:hypothetical protein